MSMQTIYLRKKKKKKNSYNQNPTSLKTPSSCISFTHPVNWAPPDRGRYLFSSSQTMGHNTNVTRIQNSVANACQAVAIETPIPYGKRNFIHSDVW